MRCFIDIETTGLAPTSEKILEVACIITDDQLREIARMECVTDAARHHEYVRMHQVVRDMHYGNGLWMESLRSNLPVNSKDGESAETLLTTFIETHCPILSKKDPPVLAGSTVSFDRAFLDVHMPGVTKRLHYRNLDVTSINELAKGFWPEVYKNRPAGNGAENAKHRAMADIEVSLETARYYSRMLGALV